LIEEPAPVQQVVAPQYKNGEAQPERRWPRVGEWVSVHVYKANRL
jgi:hypothetical protein